MFFYKKNSSNFIVDNLLGIKASCCLCHTDNNLSVHFLRVYSPTIVIPSQIFVSLWNLINFPSSQFLSSITFISHLISYFSLLSLY